MDGEHEYRDGVTTHMENETEGMHRINCVRERGDNGGLFRLSFLYFWFLMSYLRMTTVFVPVVVSLCVPPQAIYLNEKRQCKTQ